jgi:hypothetical protein
MVVKKSFLVNLVFMLSFFPFLRLLPISAETQPIAGLVAMIIILLYGVKKSVYSLTLLWLIFIIADYYVLSIILRPYLFLEISLHTIAYFIPLFIFLSLYDKLDLLSPRLYFLVLGLWLALGLIQYFEFLSPVERGLDPFLNVFANRRFSGGYGGVRGAKFFSPEPAAASISIILFMVTGIFFYMVRRIGRTAMWLAILASAIMVFLNKSATAMMFVVLFFVGFLARYFVVFVRGLTSLSFPRRVLYVPLCVILVLASVWFSSAILTNKYGYHSRFLQVTENAWNQVIVQRDVSLSTLAYIGGWRFPTVYVGYCSLGQNYGLGRGVAAWLTDFDQVARSCGIRLGDFAFSFSGRRELPTLKPCSYGSTLAFDTGVFGLTSLLVFMGLFLYQKLYNGFTVHVSAVKWGMLSLVLFSILVMGVLSVPMPWLLFCYVYHINSSVNRAGYLPLPT